MKRPILLSSVSALSAACVVAASLSATAAPADPADDAFAAARSLGIDATSLEPVYGKAEKVSTGLQGAEGTVTAFVQLDAPSAIDLHEQGRSAAEVRKGKQDVEALADAVLPEGSPSASSTEDLLRTSVTSNVVAGFTVTGDAEQVRALAGNPDVVTVYRITPKTPSNKGTDVFTQALATWQSAGLTGEGVRVGVIDTGLDYTHADFGGPGTPEAFAAAAADDGTAPIPDGTFDPAKFLGGYDFAGHTYDAQDPTSVPQPDPNPIDSYDIGGGHGTHVAGTAAGYGVSADGSTFRGDYASLTDISDFQVGPGSAPEAGIYALKVFGDLGGSTSVVVDALDLAADPNGDGDVSDHLDIVNLSLGSDGSPADDPENVFMDELATIGTLSVVASGNAGDITDVGGSPGNSATSLTVANSVGDTQTFDAVEATAPAELVGTYAFQNSVAYSGADVEAPVAFVAADFTGCAAFTAEQAATVAGKIAYLYWDDNDGTRPCGSVLRFNNAQAAGAVGVVLSSELAVFPAGISGNAGIPGGQLTGPSTDALLPAIEAGTLVLKVGPSYASAAFESIPSIGDTLNSSSSRGVHGSLGIVKPDVAAPGTGISSAGAGHGTTPVTMSGTSMATPHVAGITALVKQQHPDWTPAELKAAVMNTATHDVYTGTDRTGTPFGPERVGSGRVDALQAVGSGVLAYSASDPELVSVSFGVVKVDEPTTLVKKITLENTGSATATYGASFTQSSTAGGASVSVSPSTVTVKPGRTATVKVTFRADPATLAKELDPTSSATDSALGLPRDFVSMVTGRVVLTPTGSTGGSELRVPVQAAPKLVSDLEGEDVAFASGATEAPLELDGEGVNSGGWTSLVAPFELKATSPALPESAWEGSSKSAIQAGDIRAVGFSSTAPQFAAAGLDPADGYAVVGVAMQGEWATLGFDPIPFVLVDVEGDGVPDYEVDVIKYPETDVTITATFDLATGDNVWLDFVNGAFGDVDTTIFDNSVVAIPVPLGPLGITADSTPTFQVATSSYYAGGVVDATEPFAAGPYIPAYWFEGQGEFVYAADDDTELTVHKAADAGKSKLLLLHFHNEKAHERYEIVDAEVGASRQ